MKWLSLIVIVPAVLISGCMLVRQHVQSGTATNTQAAIVIDYQGAGTLNAAVYTAGQCKYGPNGGLLGSFSILVGRKGTYPIPAGKPVEVELGSARPSFDGIYSGYNCDSQTRFTPVANKRYKADQLIFDSKCVTRITDITDTKIVQVPQQTVKACGKV